MKISGPDMNVSRELQRLAKELDEELETIAGQRMTFCLVAFNAEPGSRVNYISNGNRSDVKTALKVLIEKWDAGMPDIPSHEIKG